MKVLLASGLLTLCKSSFLEEAFQFAAELSKNQSFPVKNARNFANAVGVLGQQFTAIDYGCWCLFDSNNGYVGNGYGQPVDEIDAECKLLHDNYNCLTIEESTCDPYNVEYNRPLGSGFAWFLELTFPFDTPNSLAQTPDDIVTQCETVNQDLCEKNACIIESIFLRTLYNLPSFDQVTFTPKATENYHSNQFDPTIECKIDNGFSDWSSARGEKKCCGQYQTYKQVYYTGNKDCCNDQSVFNTNTKKCCAGVIRNIDDNAC